MVRLLSCLLRRNSQVKERSAEERAQKIPHQHLLVRKVQPMSQKKTETASEKAAKKNNVNESEDESEQEKDADEEEPEEESTSGVPDKLSPSDSEFCSAFSVSFYLLGISSFDVFFSIILFATLLRHCIFEFSYIQSGNFYSLG
ncbi:uncharacterized protein LOC107823095 [Nicotiana tabacum]|uniref:Uncharacterized protein LOC107823095 n=2 Tax=Nicotiana tabacum TaxID=4097 RepID=A0AC58T5T7_TOBAC